MTPTDLVQAQVDAYNAQDLDAMCAYYAEDCVFADLNGAVRQTGKAEIRARYTATFGQFPHNRATIRNRIAVGDVVVDHEFVERAPGGETFDIIAIYTIKNGLIARCDFGK